MASVASPSQLDSSTCSYRPLWIPLAGFNSSRSAARTGAVCRSAYPRVVCIGGDRKAREAAKKALEDALGGKKDVFNKWEEEVKQRQSRGSRGGGDGSRGGGGGGGGGGGRGGGEGSSSWDEAKQIIFAFTGLATFYFVITNGKRSLAIVINFILFALRGFKRRSYGALETSPTAPLIKADSHSSAESHVVSKWSKD